MNNDDNLTIESGENNNSTRSMLELFNENETETEPTSNISSYR